jgi:hypothetical protein
MRATSELNQIKCMIGEPCISCQSLQCPNQVFDPTLLNQVFDPDHSCSDKCLSLNVSLACSLSLVLVGFFLGVLYQRGKGGSTASRTNQASNLNYPTPVISCDLGVQTVRVTICDLEVVSDKTIRSQLSDLSEESLFPAPPPSISDALEKEECENSEGDEAEEEETVKLRWRDVRLTRRGSLFATRLDLIWCRLKHFQLFSCRTALCVCSGRPHKLHFSRSLQRLPTFPFLAHPASAAQHAEGQQYERLSARPDRGPRAGPRNLRHRPNHASGQMRGALGVVK